MTEIPVNKTAMAAKLYVRLRRVGNPYYRHYRWYYS